MSLVPLAPFLPAFVRQWPDYGAASDFPPSLRYGAASAWNDKE